MKNIIGFDIDGVLTTPDSAAWEAELVKHFNLTIIEDPAQKDLQTRYNLSRAQMLDFFNVRSHFVFPKLQMREGANIFLQELQEKGFTVILITARTDSPETPRWLKANDIPYDLLVHQHDKAPACIEHQVQLFTEDNLDNAKAVAKHIPVLLMDTEYNRAENLSSNIRRVYNFSEIREFVLDFFQKQIA